MESKPKSDAASVGERLVAMTRALPTAEQVAQQFSEALNLPKREATPLSLATDALNEALAKAERALFALKLSVEVSVPLDEEDGKRIQLNWMRRGDDWGLYIVMDKDHKRIFQATRKQRVKAAHRLHALKEALVEAGHGHEQEIREAAAVALRFVEGS
jgi:hypothetical protein